MKNAAKAFPLGEAATLEGAETYLPESGIAWITPDFRVYDKPIIFSDGACWLTLEPETLHALYELQTHIEFMGEDVESNFQKIVADAVELRNSFMKAKEAVKFKPLKQQRF